MKYLISSIILTIAMSTQVIFDFNKRTDSQDWRVVDDVVMGGRSSGNFSVNDEGHGVFSGQVSLENNGGFSSVRHRFQAISVEDYSTAVLRIKGDGNRYQFRIKANASDYQSYIQYFQTSGEWEEIEIPLADMYPTFRGRKLDRPNFSADYIEEVTFLIGNKEPQDFKLLIDKIELQ